MKFNTKLNDNTIAKFNKFSSLDQNNLAKTLSQKLVDELHDHLGKNFYVQTWIQYNGNVSWTVEPDFSLSSVKKIADKISLEI